MEEVSEYSGGPIPIAQRLPKRTKKKPKKYDLSSEVSADVKDAKKRRD